MQDIPDLKGYIEKRKKYVTVEVGGLSWTMKLVRSDGKRLGGVGWREFPRRMIWKKEMFVSLNSFSEMILFSKFIFSKAKVNHFSSSN